MQKPNRTLLTSKRVTFEFDDELGAPIEFLASGIYKPADDTGLTAFNGIEANGIWQLYFEDALGTSPVAADAMSLNAWGLEITTYDPVPEPTTIVLFGIGILCMAGVSRKKS